MWQSDVTGKRTAHGRLGLGRGRGVAQNVVTRLTSWLTVMARLRSSIALVPKTGPETFVKGDGVGLRRGRAGLLT
jgi:hypothetical protein